MNDTVITFVVAGSPEETEKALKDYREEAEAALYLWEVYDSVGTQPKDPWEESFVSHVRTVLLTGS